MIYATHSKSAQFTLDANSADVRESTWQTLYTHNAHLSWPPHLIDEVLNDVSDPSASFQQLCASAANAPLRQSPPTTSVSIKALLGAPGNPHRTLITPFLQRMARMIASRMKISPTRQLREEIEELVTTNYFNFAPRFKPSAVRNGHIVTYGYEAFLAVRSLKCIQSAVRILRHQVPISLTAEEESIGYQPSSILAETTPDQSDLQQKLVDALRVALAEPIAWQMIHAMAYRDCTQGDVASELGVNQKTLSGGVATKVKHQLQHTLAGQFGLKKGVSTSVAEIAKSLAGLLTEEEFCMLIPRPFALQETDQHVLELPTQPVKPCDISRYL